MRLFKTLRNILITLFVSFLIITIAYTYFISPNAYKFSTYEYKTAQIPSVFDRFKIAYFSDVHLNSTKDIDCFEKIIDELNTKTFDMVIFGGDLYQSNIISSERVSKILKSIECHYGKFAVLGEKDKTLEVTEILNNGGFEVLDNQERTIYYKEKTISLLGLNNQDASTLINESNQSLFHIAINHYPDSFQQNSKDIQLQLSGHSRGGSLYIPYLGGLITDDYCKQYNHGIYQKDNASLYVTNGLKGTSDFPYKLFANNEIKFITLRYVQEQLK